MLNNIRNPRSSCLFDFQGQIRQKGDLFSPVFFPLGARGDLACKSGGVRHDPQYVMGKNVVKMWRRSFPA